MRILFAVLISVFLLGGTHIYTRFSESVRRPPVALDVIVDSGDWKITIVRTFKCVPDPDLETPSLLIQFKGNDIFNDQQEIPIHEAIVVPLREVVEQGENEIYVEANLASLGDLDFDSERIAHAMQVFVHRGDSLIAQETAWSNQGDYIVRASIPFTAPKNGIETNDSHHLP